MVVVTYLDECRLLVTNVCVNVLSTVYIQHNYVRLCIVLINLIIT